MQGSWQWEPVVVCLGEALGQNEGWDPGVIRTSWGVRAGHGSQGPSHCLVRSWAAWGQWEQSQPWLLGCCLGTGKAQSWDGMGHSLGCTCYTHRTAEWSVRKWVCVCLPILERWSMDTGQKLCSIRECMGAAEQAAPDRGHWPLLGQKGTETNFYAVEE